ncbi:MAG: DUF4279 domain-containing protein [Pseudomonadales bacterium]
MHEYDDDYRTCTSTYATLRVTSDTLSPEEISGILKQNPTRTIQNGELRSERASLKNRYFTYNGWFYCTKELSTSRDCRRHLDIIINNILQDSSATLKLQEQSCNVDIVIFYSYSQGGPTISPSQMLPLANANIDVWWDLYKEDEEDEEDEEDI